MAFSNDYIKNESAKIVSGLVNGQCSLNQGVSDLAIKDSLNPEQIKRIVEAVNTIAHLHYVKVSADKTVEFPVATFEDVEGCMVMPEKCASMIKVANNRSRFNIITKSEPLEKTASDRVLDEVEVRSQITLARQGLEKIAQRQDLCKGDLVVLKYNLVKLAKELIQEDDVFDKLNILLPNDFDTFTKVAKLLPQGLHKTASAKDRLYKESDLVKVSNLIALVKQAEELVGRMNFLADSASKLTKLAGVKLSSEPQLPKPIRPTIGQTATKVRKAMTPGLGVAMDAFFAKDMEHTKPVWETLHPTVA